MMPTTEAHPGPGVQGLIRGQSLRHVVPIWLTLVTQTPVFPLHYPRTLEEKQVFTINYIVRKKMYPIKLVECDSVSLVYKHKYLLNTVWCKASVIQKSFFPDRIYQRLRWFLPGVYQRPVLKTDLSLKCAEFEQSRTAELTFPCPVIHSHTEKLFKI